jgi:hypothetical protein
MTFIRVAALTCAALAACSLDPRPLVDGGTQDGPTCTDDLTTIINGDTRIVCSPDEACREGSCVPACEAYAERPGSIGCEFVVPTPPSLRGSPSDGLTQPCHALFVSNDSRVPVQIEIERGGQTFDVTASTRLPDGTSDPADWPGVSEGGIEPGRVAVIFLSADPASNYAGISLACPVPPILSESTALLESGLASSWRVRTSVPITAYDIMSFGGAPSFGPSASLLLPTQAWATQYLVIHPPTNNRAGAFELSHWIQVVSNAATTFQVLPATTLVGGIGLPTLPPATTTSIELADVSVAQWSTGLEASGSIVTSAQPIAVYAGSDNFCFSTPTSPGGGCDATHAQIHPIATLGSRYVAAPYTTRRADLEPESIVYRLTGVVDGTELTFDPSIEGGPTTVSAGQVIDIPRSGAFSVSSQGSGFPFALAQIMGGCQLISGSRAGGSPPLFDPTREACLGDEEWVPLLSPAQYRTSYRFFTDPSFATTTLTVIREADDEGVFHEVAIGCLGAIDGWQSIDAGGAYQFAELDLVRANVGIGACRNGAHEATSPGRFGVMVWGTDYASSYGYAAGGDQTPINSVVFSLRAP